MIIAIEPGDIVVVVIASILPHDWRRRMPPWPECRAMPRTVITFGTFDVFHVGHLRVIERAAALGDRLVVGVSADALNLRKKGREPVFTQGERLEIVAALRMVDEVFVEESLELKRDYIERVRRRRAGHGRRLGGQVRRVRRHLRGRLPAPDAGDLHHRPHREDLRRLNNALGMVSATSDFVETQ